MVVVSVLEHSGFAVKSVVTINVVQAVVVVFVVVSVKSGIVVTAVEVYVVGSSPGGPVSIGNSPVPPPGSSVAYVIAVVGINSVAGNDCV